MSVWLANLLTSPKFWGALAVGLLLMALGVQSARLDHAKADLAAARAAQIDPETKAKWQDEYHAAAQDRDTAQASQRNAEHALGDEQASVAALQAASAQSSAKAAAALQQARVATAALSEREKAMAALTAPGDVCSQADEVLKQGASP
jgi:hypothetical protein